MRSAGNAVVMGWVMLVVEKVSADDARPRGGRQVRE
jgi:hypothetical protein